MDKLPLLHSLVGLSYLVTAGLLLASKRERLALALLGISALTHLYLIAERWWQGQQLPIVTRYEDITIDALSLVLLYLLLQWRVPTLRRGAALGLILAGIGTLGALAYQRDIIPWGPALRSHWLIVHAQLNSLAIALGALSASLAIMAWNTQQALIRRLLLWTFLLWGAMVGSGAAWASEAWGRYWGWDPIETWALLTLLAYGWALHLPDNNTATAWRYAGLGAYGLMLFTTYGLLFLRYSLHSQYLFQ